MKKRNFEVFKKGKSTRNLVFLTLAIVLLATVVSVFKVTGYDNVIIYFNSADFIKGTNLNISPAELTLEATPGTTITKEFLVTNKGDQIVTLSIKETSINNVMITVDPSLAEISAGSSRVFKATFVIPSDIENPIILIDDGEDCAEASGFGGNGNPRVMWGCSPVPECPDCNGNGVCPHWVYIGGLGYDCRNSMTCGTDDPRCV